MGAEFAETVIEATPERKTDDQHVNESFSGIRRQCEWDHGHIGYTGTFAETPGVTILANSETFASADDARRCVEERAEKWENALAVPLADGRWYIGAWCSS